MSACRAAFLPGAALARRVAARQADILEDGKIRNEVEHLKYEADVIGAEAIARGPAQRADKIGRAHV